MVQFLAYLIGQISLLFSAMCRSLRAFAAPFIIAAPLRFSQLTGRPAKAQVTVQEVRFAIMQILFGRGILHA